MIKSLIKSCIILGSIVAFSPLSHAQGHESSNYEDKAAPPTKVPDKNAPHPGEGGAKLHHAKPSEYGRFRDEILVLCDYMALEGRRARFLSLLEANLEKDPECLDCRPLNLQFFQTCTPKLDKNKGWKGKKGTEPTPSATDVPDAAAEPLPTVTPTPAPERLPSLEVLDAMSTLARSIEEDQHTPAQTEQAVRNLVRLMREEKGMTAGEHEYFSELAAYLVAPLDARPIVPTPRPTVSSDEEDDGLPQVKGKTGLF